MTAHAGKDMEYYPIVGRIARLYRHYRNQYLQKLEIDLPQDPTIPLLDINTNDALSYHKNVYSTVFIVALFLVIRNWKQPGCPSTEE